MHEYAHAATADALGDPTPRYMGRLTANPLAHLDLLGTMMLVFVGFGWAKPVEVNPMNFSDRRTGMMKVAVAGPAANLLICFLATLIMVIMAKTGILSPGVRTFLMWTQLYNVWFAFFNLIPIPPLDGSKVLAGFLTPKASYEYNNIVGRYGFYILIALVFTGVVGWIVNPLATAYMQVVNGLLGMIFF